MTLNENAGSSPANTDELIGTVDIPIPSTPPEEAKKTDEEAATKAAEAQAKAAKEELRFDKHPRFQELIKGNKTLRDELKGLQSKFEESQKPPDPNKKDSSRMTEEEILEWMADDPIGYQKNQADQIRADITKELSAKTQEEKVLKTFDDYVAGNDTFNDMWDSGEIQKFIDTNPGHSSISAHMAMTMQSRIDEAVKAAQKETEARVIKNFQAKKGASVLSGGPTSTGTAHTIAPELKDPKKYGGINTVLAQRLKERRQAG